MWTLLFTLSLAADIVSLILHFNPWQTSSYKYHVNSQESHCNYCIKVPLIIERLFVKYNIIIPTAASSLICCMWHSKFEIPITWHCSYYLSCPSDDTICRVMTQVEKEVTDLMMKALRHCNVDAASLLQQPTVQYRAATIHHRLASLYHNAYRNQVGVRQCGQIRSRLLVGVVFRGCRHYLFHAGNTAFLLWSHFPAFLKKNSTFFFK